MRILFFISLAAFSVKVNAQDPKNVLLLDHWFDSSVTLGVEDARLSDVWGFYQNNEPYAAVGTTEGISFFHIKDDQLIHVDDESGAFQGYTVVHRDMKTYRNYLYAVGDEGTATLQIFDLSYLPDSVSKVYDSNAFFGICHNLFIDTLNAKLYANGANNVGMKVLDISNPVAPVLLHDFNNVNYVHDCYVHNDTAFLNCGADGLRIYNFSGPVPIELGVLNLYVDQGYNHSGWASPNMSYYAFCDETVGAKLKLCKLSELSDLSNIQIDAQFGTKNYTEYSAHNIILTDKLAFVAYYNEGFRVYDLTASPIQEIGRYDTFWQETEYKLNGAWGVYVFEQEDRILISDRQNGLFLFSFPINYYEAANESISIYNTPFVDAGSVLLSKRLFADDNLRFTIAEVSGKVIYDQVSYQNWVSIPETISAGTYVYAIYTEDGEIIESGKFVKAN